MGSRKGKNRMRAAVNNTIQQKFSVRERPPITLVIREDEYEPKLNVFNGDLGHVQCTEEQFHEALRLLGYDLDK